MTQPGISGDAPAAAPRPATVTVAFALQVALVGVLVLMVAVTVAEAIHYDALIDQAVRAAGSGGSDAAFERTANLSGALITAVPALLLAAWLGISAIWLRRGSNVARILTLVGLGAPTLLAALSCLFGGLFGLLMVGIMSAASSEGFTDGEEFTGDEDFDEWEGSEFFSQLDRLDGRGWSIAFDVLGAATVLVALLLAIATAVMLLTSASNRFFNPRRSAPRPHYPPYPPYLPYYHPAQFHGYPAPPPCPYPPAHGYPTGPAPEQPPPAAG